MKILTLAFLLCLSAMPALAQSTATVCPTAVGCWHGGPAPLIGFGIPVALAVGGVWLGAKFFKRKR